MTPSVRGWRKARVAGLLLLAASGAGALAGFAAGAVWALAPVGAISPPAVAALIALTAIADLLYWRTGRPAPLSVRRQVPRMWTTLFSPEVVAVLYGSRLGVGPLTILVTWSWWAALVLGASTGPGGGAITGGVFGSARVLLMVMVAEWARKAMADRMMRVQGLGVASSVLLVVVYATLLPLSIAIR